MPSSLLCLFLALGLILIPGCSLSGMSFVPDALAENSPSDDWGSAYLQWQNRDYSTTKTLLSSWIQTQEGKGIFSPEPHYNLALVHWQLKEPGKATYHFLKSASLSQSISETLSTIRTMQAIERDLGVREGVTETFEFFLCFLVKEDWLWFSLSIGIWGVVLAFLVAWLQGSRAQRAANLIVILPAILIFISTIGFLSRLFIPNLGVIDSEGNSTISVYRDPKEKAAPAILELPTGTLATIGRSQEDYVEILLPVTGWVAKKSLLPLEPQS